MINMENLVILEVGKFVPPEYRVAVLPGLDPAALLDQVSHLLRSNKPRLGATKLHDSIQKKINK
jgi:hypothetical protein